MRRPLLLFFTLLGLVACKRVTDDELRARMVGVWEPQPPPGKNLLVLHGDGVCDSTAGECTWKIELGKIIFTRGGQTSPPHDVRFEGEMLQIKPDSAWVDYVRAKDAGPVMRCEAVCTTKREPCQAKCPVQVSGERDGCMAKCRHDEGVCMTECRGDAGTK